MTATEFGRTARPTAAAGTDHGTATALFSRRASTASVLIAIGRV